MDVFGGILATMKTTRTVLTDDIDGSEDGVETVRFSLAGVDYDIDLNGEHREALENALAEFIAAGHKVGGRVRRSVAAPVAAAAYDVKAVRSWAAERGITIAPRGRIAKDVVEQYLASAA